MMRWRFAAGAAAIGMMPAMASAQSADDLANRFGTRESIRTIGLSPDGTRLVVVTPRPGGGENAIVISIADSSSVPILTSKGETEQILGCRFVVDSRVVCETYFRDASGQDIDQATRLFSLATDGTDMKLLSARARAAAYYESRFGGDIIDYNVPGKPNAVLMTRWYATESRTGTITSSSQEGLAVEEVDVLTLARRRVEAPRATAVTYISDGHGEVRLMALQPRSSQGFDRREINFSYRPLGGGGWRDLSSVRIDAGLAEGFQPLAVDSQENVAYGFGSTGNFQALFKRTLDGTGTTSVVLSRDDADIDQVVRIGRNQRIVGASYATDRRLVELFDPELKRLSASLARALGGDKQLSVIDSSEDESKLLLFAGSDTDPGNFYLYDKATRQLGQLLPARPELAGIALGTMQAVQYPAADGTMIPAYLTVPPGSDGKNLPAIVMPHGGPSARDEWGFDWLVQFFAARGFAVLQPNYRGSSGLGAQWFEKNGFQSWERAIGDVNAAGRWLTSEGIAAPGKLAVFGWSYGGYAALQSAVVDPALFKAIVAVAPVTDLDRLREERRGYSDFYVRDNFIGNGPHVAAGSPARHADAFVAPVLLFHGREDTNVSVDASRLMESRLRGAGKPVDYVEFDGLDHYLDDSAARTRLLKDSDAFLRRALAL